MLKRGCEYHGTGGAGRPNWWDIVAGRVEGDGGSSRKQIAVLHVSSGEKKMTGVQQRQTQEK